MMRNTILQVCDYGGSYRGNFITSLMALDEVLNNSGWRQVLVFSDIAREQPWLKELYEQEKSVYLLPRTSPFSIIKELNEIAAKENANILHTHFTTFDLPALAVMKLRKLQGYTCSTIWHIHSPSEADYSMVRHLKDMIKYRLITKDVYSIVVSKSGLQDVLARGLTENHGCFIPNGIDIKRITQATRTRRSIRQEFKVASNEILLLHLGWDPIVKGVDILLQSCSDLTQQGFKIKVFVVGTEALQKYVENLYGVNQPRWLRIMPPTECIANYFQAADIFVSASRTEGFGYAVAEAMAFGLQVVSSNIPGLEWAQESVGVEFFSSEDVDGLSEAIKRVISWTPAEKEGRVAANYFLVNQKYSMEIWRKQVFSFYKNILDNNR